MSSYFLQINIKRDLNQSERINRTHKIRQFMKASSPSRWKRGTPSVWRSWAADSCPTLAEHRRALTAPFVIFVGNAHISSAHKHRWRTPVGVRPSALKGLKHQINRFYSLFNPILWASRCPKNHFVRHVWWRPLLFLRNKGLKRRSLKPVELKSSGRAHSEEEEIQKTPPKSTIQDEAACSQLYFNRHCAVSLRG